MAYSTTSEQGFCDAEVTVGTISNYSWPETDIGIVQYLPCELGPLIPNGMARRTCDPNSAQWGPVIFNECFNCEYNISMIYYYIPTP